MRIRIGNIVLKKRHLIITLILGALIAAVMMAPKPNGSNCPTFLKDNLQSADVIFVGKLVVQEYVDYKRAQLRHGERDKYAAKHGETPLNKWKLNRFIIKQKLKGDPGRIGKMVSIVSPRFFTRGQNYIIFAREAKKLPRFKKTTAEYVNASCDRMEHVHKTRGSQLLTDVKSSQTQLHVR